MEPKRLDCIDGLKGICACIIAFIWHYQHFILPPDVPFYNLFPVMYHYGDKLVELFFVLSGFGMMLGYGKKAMDHDVSFGQFIGKRLKKLYPLFFSSTIIVAVLEFIIKKLTGEFFVYGNYDLYHFLLNLLLLQNGLLETGWSFNSPSWVISILISLYILFYYVCHRAKKESDIVYAFGIGVIAGSVIVLLDVNQPVLNPLLGRGLACFSAGVILYGLYERREAFNSKLIAYAGLAFIVVTYLVFRLRKTAYIGHNTMLMILGIAPMITFCALTVPWLTRLLSWKPLVFLGKISLPIYLLHFPVQCVIMLMNYCVFQFDFSSVLFWAGYTAATLAAAVVYDLLVSKRFEPRFCSLLSKNR